MIYSSAQEWLSADHKRITLLGMSGLGKTHLSKMLRSDAGWFHYSVDYRIGTRYMEDLIKDNAKAVAMQVPFLAELLRSDSIYIGSNITFDNLTPLSTYMGKPGDEARGGLKFDEYIQRQEHHKYAEVHALLDTRFFIDRASQLYGYKDFVCDSSGSICEVVDPNDPEDPVLKHLSENTLLVWIEGGEQHIENLIARFKKTPKPMYYNRAFLDRVWAEFQIRNGVTPDEVDPDGFIRWAYEHALAHRQPRYKAIATNWGVSVPAYDVANVTSVEQFNQLIAGALDADRKVTKFSS